MKTINDNEKLDYVISRPANWITKNTDTQENVKRRLELQREVGVIPPFINGKIMPQLRKKKRRKLTSSIYEENCHLKPAAI